MSLDDMMEPDDGGWVDRLDHLILDGHRAIANLWEDNTGYTLRALRKIGALAASAGFLADGYFSSRKDSYFLSAWNVFYYVNPFRKHTGLVMDMNSQAIGLPAKSTKLLAAVTYTMMICLNVANLARFVAATYHGDTMSCNHATQSLMGLVPLQVMVSNIYFARCEDDDYRGKREKKSILSKAQEALGNLGPEPLPIPAENK